MNDTFLSIESTTTTTQWEETTRVYRTSGKRTLRVANFDSVLTARYDSEMIISPSAPPYPTQTQVNDGGRMLGLLMLITTPHQYAIRVD